MAKDKKKKRERKGKPKKSCCDKPAHKRCKRCPLAL